MPTKKSLYHHSSLKSCKFLSLQFSRKARLAERTLKYRPIWRFKPRSMNSVKWCDITRFVKMLSIWKRVWRILTNSGASIQSENTWIRFVVYFQYNTLFRFRFPNEKVVNENKPSGLDIKPLSSNLYLQNRSSSLIKDVFLMNNSSWDQSYQIQILFLQFF